MQITNILSWVTLLIDVCLFIYLAVQVDSYRHRMRKLSTRNLSSRDIFRQVHSWQDEDSDNRTAILYLGDKKTDSTGRAECFMYGKKGDIIRCIAIHMHEDKVIEDLYHDLIIAYDYAKENSEEDDSDDNQD